MSDSDRPFAPEQQSLPGVMAPEQQRSPVPRLPRLVHDLIDDVSSVQRPGEARERLAQWLRSRHAVGGFQPETVYARYAFELTRVRHELLPSNVERFVPPELRLRLGVEPRPRRKDLAEDPLALMRDALIDPQNADEKRRQFEIQRDLALAYLALWLVTDAELTGKLDRARWDQERKTERDRTLFLIHLRKRGVITGDVRTVRLRVHLDAEPPHRCMRIDLPGEREPFYQGKAGVAQKRKTRSLDVVRLGLPDLPTVLLMPRRKGVLQTIAKMLLQRLDSPLNVPDRRGVRFIYRNERELEAGSDFIGRKICLGLAHKSHLATRDLPVNPYAAPNLRIVKDSAAFYDRTMEVQHVLGNQHVDILYSLGLEQFLLYHGRQYTAPDGLFMELFPPTIYGVDWEHPQVQLRVYEHIRASLAP
ncbi:hypothetical protein EPO33_03130 [Patescibacteria group bacterium]|nr:MAG: hypothetical protein EPO33_03130 [Patescibacteria group bacterium]